MAEPTEIQGSPVQKCIPVVPHYSRLPYPPVSRVLPFNSSYPSNLGPKRLQGFHLNFQMSSYALMDTGFQMPQEHARNVRLQRTQYPVVPTGFPTQSSLQRHPVLTSNLDHQMSQSFLLPGGSGNQTHLERHLGFQGNQNLYMSQRALEAQATTEPSSLQWDSEYQRYQVPQVSFGSSSKPCIRMDPDLGGNSSRPTSGTNPVHSIPQIPSSSSEWSDNYSEVHLSTPKQKKRRRIKYSEEQNRRLQDYFDECMHPRKKQRMELAENLGVTEYQIQIWFKNRRAKYKHKNLQNVSKPPENMESPKDVDGSTSSHGCSSVLDSATEESTSSGTSCVGSILQLYPSLDKSHSATEESVSSGTSFVDSIPQLYPSLDESHSATEESMSSGTSCVDSIPQLYSSLEESHSVIEESLSSGTSCVDSIPQLYSSLEESLHNEEASGAARCGCQEDHCDGQAPAAAAGSDHFLVTTAQNDTAVAECASAEAPPPIEAAFHEEDYAEASNPVSKELWEQILNDPGVSEDWLDFDTSLL